MGDKGGGDMDRGKGGVDRGRGGLDGSCISTLLIN